MKRAYKTKSICLEMLEKKYNELLEDKQRFENIEYYPESNQLRYFDCKNNQNALLRFEDVEYYSL